MLHYPRIFSGAMLLAIFFTGCGQHSSTRLPALGKAKGSGAVSRDLAEKVELAIFKGDAEELEAGLAAGFPVNQALKSGLSPLLEAIARTPPEKFEKIFSILQNKGADPAQRDPEGRSAVELAQGKRVALRLLQPEKNQELLRELFELLRNAQDRSEIVAIFKEQGEDINVGDPETGHTPLTFSISVRSKMMFGALTTALYNILNVNKKMKDGRTPLRFARENGDSEWTLAVNKLLELGAKEE